MASEFVHNGGNMASFIDKLGFFGARDGADPSVPIKMFVIEGPNFSSVARLKDGNNQEVELYEILYKAFGEGYILHPSFTYSTAVTNLRVQGTAKDITATLDSGVITVNVPVNNRLQQINLVGTSAHLASDNKLKVKIKYTYDSKVDEDSKLFEDFTTLGFPSISAWDMQLVDLATNNVIDSTFTVKQLSVAETPRQITLSSNNVIQIEIGGFNLFSTWGVSIRLPY